MHRLVIILLAIACLSYAATDRATCVLTLNDAQCKLVADARGAETNVQLTQEQISIVVHNFPKARVSSLKLASTHLNGKNVTLQVSSDGTAVSATR